MAIPTLYAPENLARVRLGQIAVVVIAVAVTVYLVIATFVSMHEVWNAKRLLSAAKTEAAELSRAASRERARESRQAKLENSGVGAFAVRFSSWAKARNIRVEYYTPEGLPTPSEIESGGVKLGVWNASKVRVKGEGGFREVVSLLNEFRVTRAPVRIDSFTLQSSQEADGVRVSFDLLLTVYEKVRGPEQTSAAG